MAPLTLAASAIHPAHPDYAALLGWPFPSDPFYVGQVLELLATDLPARMVFDPVCAMWLYRDAAGTPVGFGTLDVSEEYAGFAGGLRHAYIPVLAVHPAHNGRGYGKQIVEHLFSEAVIFHRVSTGLSALLFLDVYQANAPAIGLYEKCQFRIQNPDTPIPDPKQNGEPYFVMARKLA